MKRLALVALLIASPAAAQERLRFDSLSEAVGARPRAAAPEVTRDGRVMTPVGRIRPDGRAVLDRPPQRVRRAPPRRYVDPYRPTIPRPEYGQPGYDPSYDRRFPY